MTCADSVHNRLHTKLWSSTEWTKFTGGGKYYEDIVAICFWVSGFLVGLIVRGEINKMSILNSSQFLKWNWMCLSCLAVDTHGLPCVKDEKYFYKNSRLPKVIIWVSTNETTQSIFTVINNIQTFQTFPLTVSMKITWLVDIIKSMKLQGGDKKIVPNRPPVLLQRRLEMVSSRKEFSIPI